MRMRMTTRHCLLVSSTLSGSRIHPHYVKRFRKICPGKSVGWLNELPQNRGREQLRGVSGGLSAGEQSAWGIALACAARAGGPGVDDSVCRAAVLGTDVRVQGGE